MACWSLVNGSLTIPGTGIEIRQSENSDVPYWLYAPNRMALNYWSLEKAKIDGERLAKEIAVFRAPD